MKKTLLITAILLTLIYPSSGQSSSINYSILNEQDTIYGVVKDDCDGFFMDNVSIKATGTQIFSTTTNNMGYYELVVDTGTYNIEFSTSGYDTTYVLGLPVTGNSNIEINANMHAINYSPVNVVVTLNPSETTCYISWEMSSDLKNNNFNKKDLVAFVVARISNFTPCNNPSSGTLTPLAGSPTSYDVSSWSSGFYAFAVKAVYSCGASTWTYSNTFSLKLNKEVTFSIGLCDDTVLENSEITLVGKDCPWNTYNSMTDTLGLMIFDKITEGYYNLQINHPGYISYETDSISILTDTIFNIVLNQNINPPRNLYVDTLSNIATWDEPVVLADSAEIINYYIFLDDVLIDSVDAYQLSYTFLELTTGQSYNACIEAKYACGLSESTCYSWESQLLSVNDNDKVDLINIFPNPANNYITITSAMPISSIKISNYVGKEIFSSEINGLATHRINTGSYHPGVYVVSVKTSTHVVTKRIIIVR